jgi:hypothetical protein
LIELKTSQFIIITTRPCPLPSSLHEYRPPKNSSRNANSREPLIPSNQALHLALTKASKEGSKLKEKNYLHLCLSCVNPATRKRQESLQESIHDQLGCIPRPHFDQNFLPPSPSVDC